MPSEAIVIDKLVIPSMVDFDSMLVEVNSLQSYHTSSQANRPVPATFFEKVYITKDMLKQPEPNKPQEMYHLYQ